MRREHARLLAQSVANESELLHLRWENADLRRRLWGKSSEKRALPELPGQLSICFDSPVDVADPIAEQGKAAEKAEKKDISKSATQPFWTF